MKFDDLIGKTLPFYGVDNNRFKIGKYVFEVLEDESDGYRSMLQEILFIPTPNNCIFFKTPVARVKIEVVDDLYGLDGYKLIDVNDDHSWLEFGTNNGVQYYPSFVFYYQPKPPKARKMKSIK